MYSSYYCTNCEKSFAKVGGIITKRGKIINPAICPTCKNSHNVITNAEFLEKLEKLKEEEEKKNLDSQD